LGIGELLLSHLALAGVSLLVAMVIAIPLGLAIGHTGRGRTLAIPFSNATRALPTLGLLAILILLLGIGVIGPIIVLVILGIPPLLAGAYAGLEAVDRQTIDAARAIGMTEFQILLKVEIPLAAGLLMGGIRASALQIVATVAIASTFSLDSLGSLIITGVQTANYVQMVAGSILVIALALVTDGVFAIAQRFATPRGITSSSAKRKKNHSTRSAFGMIATTPPTEGK